MLESVSNGLGVNDQLLPRKSVSDGRLGLVSEPVFRSRSARLAAVKIGRLQKAGLSSAVEAAMAATMRSPPTAAMMAEH
jgi:hypothetical protein